jgi:hypothetical protein
VAVIVIWQPKQGCLATDYIKKFAFVPHRERLLFLSSVPCRYNIQSAGLNVLYYVHVSQQLHQDPRWSVLSPHTSQCLNYALISGNSHPELAQAVAER